MVCAKARELVAQGMLGDLMLVEGSLGRNDPTGAWEYPPPPDLSPQTLDWDTWQGTVPKRAFDPKIFARWRCWKEYGTGVAGDLLVHLVSGMQYILGINEAPGRTMSMGGILRWNDGRNMPDVHATLFEYHGVPVYMRLNLGTETPETYRFMGSKGIIDVTEYTVTYTPQTGEDTGPSYYANAFPKPLRDAYMKRLARRARRHARERTRRRGGHLPQRVVRRFETSLVGFFPRRAHAQAGDRRCGLRTPRRAGLPHGKRVLLPQERGQLGRRIEEHQELRRPPGRGPGKVSS